jgi:acyl carrier protein
VIAAMVNEIQGSSGSSSSFSSAPAASAPVARQAASSNNGGAAEATRVVMEVLASKTGYDTEMIEDDMELETELGIDSIKRVEILSEVQSRLNVEAKDIAALSRTRTVGEVIAAMVNEIKGTSNSPQKGTYILPE